MPDTPSITVKDLAKDIGWLGIEKKSNAEITGQLEQFKAGNFSSLDSLLYSKETAMRFVGVTEPAMQRSAGNALKLINEDFRGDAKAGMNFLKEAQGTKNLGNLDFNELVQKGDAHKLILLKQQNPEKFNDIANGHYASPQDLENDINAIPVEPGGKQAPVPASAPSSDAPVPATEKQAYNGHSPNRHAMNVALASVAAIGVAAAPQLVAEVKTQKVAQAQVKNTAAHGKLRATFTV